MQPKKLGQLIQDGFNLFKENLVLFSKIVLVVQIPLMIFSLIMSFAVFYPLGIGELPTGSLEEYLSTIISRLANPVIITLLVLFILILIFLSGLGSIAQIIVANRRIRGEEVEVIECLKEAFSKFWSYIWVGTLAGLAVLGGIILLVIPGVIFAVWFTFSGYVVVLENIKGKEALSFSKKIVSGYFWKVLGNIIAVSLIVGIVVWFINLPASLLNNPILGVISDILGRIVSVLTVVIILLLYLDLKKLKDFLKEKKIIVSEK